MHKGIILNILEVYTALRLTNTAPQISCGTSFWQWVLKKINNVHDIKPTKEITVEPLKKNHNQLNT